MIRVASPDDWTCMTYLSCYSAKARDIMEELIRKAPLSFKKAIRHFPEIPGSTYTYTFVTEQFEIGIEWYKPFMKPFAMKGFGTVEKDILNELHELFVSYLEFVDPYSTEVQCLAMAMFKDTSLWDGKLQRLCLTDEITEQQLSDVKGAPPDPLLQTLMKHYLDEMKRIEKENDDAFLFGLDSNSRKIEQMQKSIQSYAMKVKQLFYERKPA